MPATRRLILIIIVLLLLLLFLTVPGVSWAQTSANPWQDPARELARKVGAITGPRQTVALAVHNLSSLSDSEVAAVRLAIEAELRAAGLRLATKPSGAPELRVTLSENLQGLLWVAEIPRDNSRDVAWVSLPKSALLSPIASSQAFVLQSKLIYEQDEPILDFRFSDPKSPSAPRLLLVLKRAQVEIYEPDGSSWRFFRSAPLPQPVISTRDQIADLRTDAESFFWVFLAGFVCRGSPQPLLEMDCWDKVMDHYSTSPSKLEISPQIVQGRNFYRVHDFDKGDPIEHQTLHYSEIWIKQDGRSIHVEFGLDGIARVFLDGEGGTNEFTKSGWGSQLGVVKSGCGKGMQLLVTAPGDWTEPDAIQAVEFDGLQPISVSTSLMMPGPVIKFNFDPASGKALAVVRNLKTNHYEAYTLTLSCGR